MTPPKTSAESVRIRLKRLREKSGLSVAAVAEALGMPKSTYASYENKYKREFLPGELVRRLEPVFSERGVPVTEIRSLAVGFDVLDPVAIVAQMRPLAENLGNQISGRSRRAEDPNARSGPTGGLLSDKQIPVYASAEGGAFGMTISYDPIEHISCPAPLVGVKDAFGFYIVGDSMVPKYGPGDLVCVHPHKPARPGHYVVVILKSEDEMGHDALVKRLVSISSTHIVLEQLNPQQRLDPIPRERVQGIHLIVASFEGGV